MAQPWWTTAAFYQIYVRSFQDSDGDGIGDLPGITARLDYLRGRPDSLGVDAIWLTPFYPSPGADFGYDISDFTDVDPQLGTLDDVRAMIGAAHERGIRVIVDWVPNHTSVEHPWFRDSRASRSSHFRDWFVWRAGTADGSPPNNWMADFAAVGPAWTYDQATQAWFLHSFTPAQPDLNWDNAKVRAAMHDVLRFWLDLGVDGFRMDVINKIGKDPALADNPVPLVGPGQPPTGRRHDEDWPSTHRRIAAIRRVVKQNPDAVMAGEVYVLDQRRLARYLQPGQLDLAHNFVFLNQPWHASRFRDCVDTFMRLLPAGASPTWCLNNHDHSRVPSRYGDAESGDQVARLAATMLATLPGAIFLYQGEELGLRDLDLATALDVDGRDRCRAPVPWLPPSTGGPGAGFTTGRPWLPVPPDAERQNVQTESARPDSIWALYRALLALRRKEVALREGDYRSIDAGPDLFAFLRRASDQTILVVLNFARSPRRVSMKREGLPVTGRVLAGTVGRTTRSLISIARLELEALEGLVLELRLD